MTSQLELLAASRQKKKHAHWWVWEAPAENVPGYEYCQDCGLSKDDFEARQRRGRNNRKRGQAIQRERIVGLGGRNLAGNNPNLDGIHALFAFEAKSGAAFPERFWKWLKGIPHDADQVPVLIVSDAPGPGRKARTVVVIDYADWKDLHG
jgi:hypothetical protein